MHLINQLLIPVSESEEVVAVSLSELPEEPEDVLEILASEAAPLATWFDFARAYLEQSKVDKYIYICNEGVREDVATEVEKFFGSKPIYEQIQFYCGLAGFYMAKAKDEKDKTKKGELFNTAIKNLSQAKVLDPKEQIVWLGYGLLAAAKGDMHIARQEFSKAIPLLNNGRPNILGYLAVAGIQFSQKQYKEALALYRRALREFPGCPAEVRLGIATCQFRLGELTAAELAYERVLELDPDCSEALLGLAVIKFNSPNVQQGLADGLKLLVRAYELDPINIPVLTLLSHYCLLRGDYDKVLLLAKCALETTDSDTCRADLLTLLARAYHATGQFTEAFSHYVQASRLDQSLPMPHYGLAQMYLRRPGESMNAASELEAALKAAPQFYDALKILGRLYPRNPTKVEKTISHFRDAAAKQDADAEIWEMLGELLSPSDPAGSLVAYKHALEIHTQRHNEAEAARKAVQDKWKSHKQLQALEEDALFGDSGDELDDSNLELPPEYIVPPKLLNNVAVLSYRAGEKERAKSLLEQATACMSHPSLSPLHKITLGYNLARLQEACGDYNSAVAGYTAITEQFPGYVDCYLRLACVQHSRGFTTGAMQWVRRALELSGSHADGLALMSQLHMEKGELKTAREVICKLVTDEPSKHDTYGRLAFANLYLMQAHEHPRKPKNMGLIDDRLKKALHLFHGVLEADPHNVYAANGVGVVLAEKGHFDEAAEIFSAVQEAVAAGGGFLSLPEVWVNLGNLHLARREYVSAIKTYNAALSKYYKHHNGQVLLYLARAHYDSGDLMEAKRVLLRALHAVPTDYRLRFNIAVTMQQWAVKTLSKKRPENDMTKVDEYKTARSEVVLALKTFQHLESKEEEVTKLDKSRLKTHISFCRSKDEDVARMIAIAETDAATLRAKRMEQEAKLHLAAQKRLKEELETKAQEDAKTRARELAAKRALERSDMLRAAWKLDRPQIDGDGYGEDGETRASKGSKKKKRRKERAQEEEEEGVQEEEEEYREEQKPHRQAEVQEEDDLFDDEEDDQDYAGGEGSERGVEEEEDQEAAASPSGQVPSRRLNKRDRRATLNEEEQNDGLEDEEAPGQDLEDLEDEDEGAAGQHSAKRSRRAAVEDDEDEEQERVPAQNAGTDDLFDDDDDDQ